MSHKLIFTAAAVILVLTWMLASKATLAETGMGMTVRFDTTGWELRESSETRRVWTNSEGDALSLDRVQGPTDLLVDDLKSMQARCRELAKANEGGLVSADVLDVRGVSAVMLIYRREELPAYAYTGMMIVPGKGEHFVFVVASVERGMTGVRDTLVTVMLIDQGKLDPTETVDQDKLEGWFYDPYDSAFDAGALNSVADDEQYDSLVPSHPLSKVRRTLRAIAASLHWNE